MYTLLIVEDEIYIANKIKSGLDWEELNVSEVFVAHNIRQARDVIEHHAVDVVLCDIEMPQGSGIDLLAWVRENELRIEFIYLTCHSEFEFTKKAIQYGSLDYLLKPAQPEELRAAVLTAIRKIDKERPLRIERFWFELLHQRISWRQSKHEFPYPESQRFFPILIGVHGWGKPLSIREENIMEYAVRKAAEELVLRDGRGVTVHVNRGVLLALLPVDEGGTCVKPDELTQSCQAFIEACDRYFYCRLSCYLGEPVSGQDMLSMFERLAERHLNNVSRMMKVHGSGESTTIRGSVSMPQLHIWSELLKRGDRTKLLAEIARFFETWNLAEGLDAKRLQQFYQGFLQMFLYTMQQEGIAAEASFPDQLSPERALLAKRTVTDLERWVKELLEAAFLLKRQEDTGDSFVEKIKRYITLHIDQPLSRQYIADHIGLSPDYLVKLFKKETGLSISDYVLQERMNISKEFLANTDLPIGTIASSIGFSNFAYFSTIFKKEVSMTPQEYRKAYQEETMHRP